MDFDLELGPVLSCIFPFLTLFPFEAENMSVILPPSSTWLYVLNRKCARAFSAFPDSAQFREGSQTHSFRIREQIPPLGAPSLSTDTRPPPVDGFLYGYSHFNQRKDAASKRGYVQVLTTSLTWNLSDIVLSVLS